MEKASTSVRTLFKEVISTQNGEDVETVLTLLLLLEKEYCTYDNGVEAGEKNRFVSNICNISSVGSDFHKGHKIGKKRYKKQQEISNKNKELKDLDKKLKALKEGKVKGGIKEVDLIYREKELINKERFSLEKELANIK